MSAENPSEHLSPYPLGLADDRVLTLSEFAKIAGISLVTLRRRIAAHDGPIVTKLSERRLGIRRAACKRMARYPRAGGVKVTTARAMKADEDGPDLGGGHSPKLTAGQRAEYQAGVESLVRTIRMAAPERRRNVFRNAVSEGAGYVGSGFAKQIVIDQLNEAATSVGLDANAEALMDSQLSDVVLAIGKTAFTAERSKRDEARLKPIRWSDFQNLPKREALIEGFLDSAALSVMFGPSGCGKTFFALDLAAHVALGRPWRGRAVLQGAVVYVAPEGGHGIQERLMAFSCQHGIDPKGVPLYVIPEPIDLCHSETDVDLLMNHLGDLLSDQPVRLLIIDTVSRALAGGNENSSDHMGAFIKRCDKLRANTGAHAILLHHTGKDTSQGARGHSSLRAAVDTEIEMTWDKEGQSGLATVTKQRDSRTEGAFAFKLTDFEVDMRADKSPITSCAVVPVDGSVATTTKPARMSKAARTALGALRKAVDELGAIPAPSDHIPAGVPVITIEQWRQCAIDSGISGQGTTTRAKQKAFKGASEKLVAGKYVGRWADHVWLTKE